MPRRAARLVIRPLTPARWDDLTRLFGPRGACGGCWCMWPRLTAAEFAVGKAEGGARNRRSLRALVDRRPPGLLGYVDGEPAAWCAVAPRDELVRLRRSKVLAPVDARPVWSIPCLFVSRDHRGRGLSTAMVAAAARWAGRQGARLVEAYPIDPAPGARLAPTFAWWGVTASYRRAGFREVARRSPTRPIVRRAVRR
ncbi:MAG: GNAT family N-acetyltransferase [Kofleriaceae bacterium]|nr:GNAT family N-acetyltransferase [Kofleriaceae bacterium]MCL4224320.1 GNAT family N-acetyltransferase [Myxococcales bacterium]